MGDLTNTLLGVPCKFSQYPYLSKRVQWNLFRQYKNTTHDKMDVQEEANYLDWSYLTYVICARFAMLWTWGISFKFWHFLNPLCAPQNAMLGLWPRWPINHEHLQFWPN